MRSVETLAVEKAPSGVGFCSNAIVRVAPILSDRDRWVELAVERCQESTGLRCAELPSAQQIGAASPGCPLPGRPGAQAAAGWQLGI